MKLGRIVIISGPSGSGKTTLYKRLLSNSKFKGKVVKSISITTRIKRLGEKDGRDYLFIEEAEFLNKRKGGYFLEAQKVFGNYYGTPREKVDKILKSGKHVLLCIDVKGAKEVLKQRTDALKIFIKPPSVSDLRERLNKRATESRKDLARRLKTACQELKESKNYNYIVVNDNLKKAYKRLEKILLEELFRKKNLN